MSAAEGISYSVSIDIISAVVASLDLGNGYSNLAQVLCIYAVKTKGFFKLPIQWRKRADPKNTLIQNSSDLMQEIL